MAARCFLEILSLEQLVIEGYAMLLLYGCVDFLCDIIIIFYFGSRSGAKVRSKVKLTSL